jgi:23S rRNA (uracil1939-C5)-methyltransferase
VKIKRGDRQLLKVTGLDGGDGLAALGEYTVRVRGALPGDEVVARMQRVQARRRLASAKLLSIQSQTIERVAAPCSHVGICGGCIWQDVPYPEQLRIKRSAVQESLNEAGITVTPDDPLPAADPYFYRNKMEFSFGSSAEGLVELGLHASGRFDRIFDLEACHLQSDASNRIVDLVRRFARDEGLVSYDLRQHRGLLRFLTIREGKSTGETMVVLTTSGEPFPNREALGRMLMDDVPEVASVIHSVNRRKAQVAMGDEEHVLAGQPAVRERLGKFVFEISPGSFFQTNSVQAEQLYQRVTALAEMSAAGRALDVYCGAGGISFFLSEEAGSVVGVESSEAAVNDAARNSANNEVHNCSFVAGEAERVLGEMAARGERFECAVTDPPRPGMHPKALEALAGLRPSRIVYVSCNPKALGVDLGRLVSAGYRVDYLQLVDMFPHTPHCEVVARLRDEGAG